MTKPSKALLLMLTLAGPGHAQWDRDLDGIPNHAAWVVSDSDVLAFDLETWRLERRFTLEEALAGSHLARQRWPEIRHAMVAHDELVLVVEIGRAGYIVWVDRSTGAFRRYLQVPGTSRGRASLTLGPDGRTYMMVYDYPWGAQLGEWKLYRLPPAWLDGFDRPLLPERVLDIQGNPLPNPRLGWGARHSLQFHPDGSLCALHWRSFNCMDLDTGQSFAVFDLGEPRSMPVGLTMEPGDSIVVAYGGRAGALTYWRRHHPNGDSELLQVPGAGRLKGEAVYSFNILRGPNELYAASHAGGIGRYALADAAYEGPVVAPRFDIYEHGPLTVDFFDERDNCPDVPNPDQADTNGDGIGDACEVPDDLECCHIGRIPPVNCCRATGEAGCAEPVCEDRVCGADEYCCDTEWDQWCIQAAEELCGCSPDQP